MGVLAAEPQRLTEEDEKILDHIWATIDEPWEDDDEPIVPAAIVPSDLEGYSETEETETEP